MKKFLCILMSIGLLTTFLWTGDIVHADNEPVTTITLKTPPEKYYLAKDTQSKKVKVFTLKQTTSKNSQRSSDQWYKKNKLTKYFYSIPSPVDNYKTNVPDNVVYFYYDLILTRAFFDNKYIYATYGNDYSQGYILNIFDKKTEELLYSYDFSNYLYTSRYVEEDFDFIQQRILYASIKNGILYVSHSHNTYAYSSKNKNAFITAINLKNNKIIWNSQALVANSENFVISKDVIITGYGFNNEPDYLYQLNLYTGKVIKKTKVDTQPSYLQKKGNYLYIKTYNKETKYKLSY